MLPGDDWKITKTALTCTNLPTYCCVFKVIEAVVGQNKPPSLPRLHPAACGEKHNMWAQSCRGDSVCACKSKPAGDLGYTCHIWFWSSSPCIIRFEQRLPPATPSSLSPEMDEGREGALNPVLPSRRNPLHVCGVWYFQNKKTGRKNAMTHDCRRESSVLNIAEVQQCLKWSLFLLCIKKPYNLLICLHHQIEVDYWDYWIHC